MRNNVVQRYQGRKSFPNQNLLIANYFDLKSTYVLSRWGGFTFDSRVLNNALTSEFDSLIIRQGEKLIIS